MKRKLLIILLNLPWLLEAQVVVKGLVTEQNSGNKPLQGVQIKALGSTPEQSDNAGAFRLNFSTKKPGDRIVVSEIAKSGYEIVNKEVVSNWVIAANPDSRTKIVMCPEGLIAQNTLRYYNISLAGLTKSYQDQVRELQRKKEMAELDAGTFGEKARQLAEQYEKQQGQLEELAEKFARENFDDCSAIHKQAFERFSNGDIDEAIRILESVDSGTELAKAQRQKARGQKLEREGRQLQVQSDSIIRQNIAKLMFQADLYKSQFRFEEAEKTYEMALYADTTNLPNLFNYIAYLLDQFKTDKCIYWNSIAQRQAHREVEVAHALTNTGFIWSYLKRFQEAGNAFNQAVDLYRKAADSDSTNLTKLSYGLGNLADFLFETNAYNQSLPLHRESIRIRRQLVATDPAGHRGELARQLQNQAMTEAIINQVDSAKAHFKEALAIYRELAAREPDKPNFGIAWVLMGLARLSEPDTAAACYQEGLTILRELAKRNATRYNSYLARMLSGYADLIRGGRKFEEARDIYQEAVDLTNKLILINPVEFREVHATALTNLASTEEDLNDLQQAELHYEQASQSWRTLVESNPDVYAKDLAAMLHNQSYLFIKMKAPDRAESNLKEAIRLAEECFKTNPEETGRILFTTNIAYARFMYDQNKPDQGASIFANAMKTGDWLSDKFPEQYQRMVAFFCGDFSFRQVKNRQFELAEITARKGLQMDSTQNWIITNLATALLFQDRVDEAMAIYRKYKDLPYHGHPPTTFKFEFLKDLVELEQLGITHKKVKKIRKMLEE